MFKNIQIVFSMHKNYGKQCLRQFNLNHVIHHFDPWNILISKTLFSQNHSVTASQCAHGFYSSYHKIHNVVICKTVQNQLKKYLLHIGLPKFPFVNMAGKCNQRASFTIENLVFFEDYSFGSPILNIFLGWFWIVWSVF